MLLVVPDLVIFCPLPPKPNGIADYLAEQLPYLSQELRVCVVIENAAPKPVDIPQSVVIIRLEEYLAAQFQLALVPHLYHVGNNPDTRYMLEILLKRPGIVVVHDLNLHYLIDLTNLSLGDEESYTRAMFNQYGSAGEIIGSQVSKFGWKGKHMPHELMMNRSIISAASSVIVHSEYSANFIKAEGHKNVHIIPHHLSPEIRHHQTKLKMSYRGQLGLPGNKPVITSMGFIAKAKQIRAVLASLSVLKQQGRDFLYVLAGQCKQHEYDVYQDIAEFGLQSNVLVTGFLSHADFFKYLIASDFIVNLRYPSGGESSGTLTRAFGLGLGCIVVNIGPFAEIPDNCAIKIDYNQDFSEKLTAVLDELISQPNKRVELGLNARRWVEKNHNIQTTTSAYLGAIAAERKRLSCLDKKEHLTRTEVYCDTNFELNCYPTESVVESFVSEEMSLIQSNQFAGQHWWRNSFLPLCTDRDFLYISDKLDGLNIAEKLCDVNPENTFKCTAESLSFGSIINGMKRQERFLIILPVRLIQSDPVKVFAAINNLLEVGALGCVTLVWDSDVINDVEFSRNSLIAYWTAAGFAINHFVTGAQNIDFMPLPNVYEQEWCFSLTKVSDMVNLSPQPYYSGCYSSLKNMSVSFTQGDSNA
ncbi:glycosyltransferase [Aliiglaciecola sp. 3_MG-2023]|uniref:glycosyltransferase n=1 Tax=Aliiglaciecola sp. 3_MG-2023 TaxID=3062644 RepID=UPI0026E1F010|nr:glycosyltransferase [Aliiglaciecola sp. 3_MG-2023]MDO6691924.1 glycosyltransferase [Aliiglaciecola sp. 3_MG-2023]